MELGFGSLLILAAVASALFLAGAVLAVIGWKLALRLVQQMGECMSSTQRLNYEILDMLAQAAMPDVVRQREAAKVRAKEAQLRAEMTAAPQKPASKDAA